MKTLFIETNRNNLLSLPFPFWLLLLCVSATVSLSFSIAFLYPSMYSFISFSSISVSFASVQSGQTSLQIRRRKRICKKKMMKNSKKKDSDPLTSSLASSQTVRTVPDLPDLPVRPPLKLFPFYPFSVIVLKARVGKVKGQCNFLLRVMINEIFC